MQCTLGIRTSDWLGGRMAGAHLASWSRVRRAVSDAMRVSAREWAGRIGWLIGAGYATTVIIWAVMRYAA